jgi:hypothetical protein
MKQLPLGLKLPQNLQAADIGKLQIQGSQIKSRGADSMQELPARGKDLGSRSKRLKQSAQVPALLGAVFDNGDLHHDGEKTATLKDFLGFSSCKKFFL